MAKTESTAVNELINLVQGNAPAPAEPAADLFSAPPQPTRVNPPRMTSPLPPMRGAGEVEPLPRGRAPHSTSQQLAFPTPVRMSTADPERGNTIPPLAGRPASSPPPRPRTSGSALPPPRNTPRGTAAQRTSSQLPAQRPPSGQLPAQRPPSGQLPAQRPPSTPPIPQRASSPRAPSPSPSRPPSAPPIPQRASSASPLPVQQRPTVPSMPSLPPPMMPVAAPFDARATVPQEYPIINRAQPIDATGDIVRADNWFESTAAVSRVDHHDGTAIVKRQHRETLALIKKMIAPTIILAIVGVMVGGYFAFDGQGGKKKKQAAAATAPESTRVAMPVVAPPAANAANTDTASTDTASTDTASTDTASTDTASADTVAQPEPPTKAEQLAKVEAANTEAATTAPSMLPAATTAVVTAAAPVAAPAPAPAAAPAPVAAPPANVVAAPAKAVATSATPPPIREVQTTRGVVTLVDVRIDSKPSGATVMLVDNGKTSFLGSTPLATSLDPSRKYDVIFTLPGRPTQMAPLDPAKTSKLDVTLGRSKSDRKKKEATVAKLDNDFFETPKAEAKAEPKAEPKPAKKAAAPAPVGEGTLMVSSKPPCEILIDGKPTGLTTPQRSIPLPAGTHKITFVNATEGIKKTVSVSITADQSTKLIQDLMKK